MEQKEEPKVRREIKELSLLFEISRALAHSMDLREVVDPLMKSLADNMGIMRGSLTLLNRKSGEIYIDSAYGLSQSQQKRGKYKLGEGITGKVIQTGRPAVVPQISEEPMFLDRTGARKNLSKKDISFICVPIKLGNEVIGAISVDRLFSEAVTLDEDVRLLTIIGSLIGQAVKMRQAAQEERQHLLDENERLQQKLKDRFRPANIVGSSKAMQGVFDLIATVSKSDTTVLLRGESGTGKELVANSIHYNSLRAAKPFIKVNCAALPESIIESELFGHEKGAFTGAIAQRKGRFELASGGTIFLDEIGDLSAATQIKLLRVLQEKEFERVGGTASIKADVRVIAATNRELEEMLEEESFRHDLYYRLNVFSIHVPPLRERKTDIPLLANFFVEKYSKANNKSIQSISESAINMMMSYHWPGNVRELENCIERAVIFAEDSVIHSHYLPPTLQSAGSSAAPPGDFQANINNMERELIIDALKSSRGNKAKAARAMGISERMIGLRVAKYGIDPRQFRS
jgi:Nif-specific regulatory protein